MAKIKEIKKAAPQPRQGKWWFKITLDNGEEALYPHESEEPFKAGDELPPYEIKEEPTGRGATRKILFLLPEKTEGKEQIPQSSGTDKASVILSAKARACIDAMGYAATIASQVGKKASEIYPALVKMIYGELDKL